MTETVWDMTARQFEVRSRRYARPGQLAAAVDPLTRTSPALEKIDDALVELMDPASEYDALAIAMPPQEGKSQRVSRRFPTWLLDHDPSLRIAIVSYELDTALRWGRDIKQDIGLAPCRHPGTDCRDACGGIHVSIRRDSMAAGRWETPAGGGVYCVGVGGPLAGRPVDVLIIDDPVKDRAAAESQTIRDRTWDWWESVALARVGQMDSRVLMITTRWHEDDLWGRIFQRPSPRTWRKLEIPAIARDKDELGRKPGEELQSARRRKRGYFKKLQQTMSPYAFNGIYQQTPAAPEGNFFRRASFRYWRWGRPTPDGREILECEGRRYAYMDLYKFATMDVAASEKTTADYTVCAVWALTMDGILILLDRRRARITEHDHFAMVEPMRNQWQFDTVYVEKSYYSKTMVSDARDHNVPIAEVIADTDKITRAIPAADRIHTGRCWFPATTLGCKCGNCPDGKWLDEWCDELAIFPKGSHDDQVDVLSYAARVAVHDWSPPPAPARPGLPEWERLIASAHESATGDSTDHFNAMEVPY